MSKGSEYLDIPVIGRVIAIWDEVLFKLRVSFDGMLTSYKLFSEYIHRIEAHLDLVVEFLDIHSSVFFEFCLDEELIEFW